jgi:two-component system nitrate/nitrite response regulator NarL
MSDENPPRPVTVALVDDNRISRDEHARQIEADPNLTVVSAEATLRVSMLTRVVPDVVLVEAETAQGSVKDTLTTKRVLPDTSVIITDLVEHNEEIADFVKAGASGFVLKEASVTELVDTVRDVAEGAHVLPDALTSPLFVQLAKEGLDEDSPKVAGAAAAPGPDDLTAREREIVTHIRAGLGNKQIAVRLHITPHTVKAHIRNIMRKTGLHSRVQLAMRPAPPPSE